MAVPSEELHLHGDRSESVLARGLVLNFGKDVLEGKVERSGGEDSRDGEGGQKSVLWGRGCRKKLLTIGQGPRV